MSTTVVSPATTSLKRLRGRQSDDSHDDGDAARNPLAEVPEPASGSGPVNQDHFNDATNDGIQERLAWPSPSAETMDWISFDWANGGLNPFSAADFDPSNRGTNITPHVLGSFPEPLDGLQNLGAVTSLSIPAPERDAGDPFLGLDGEAGHTPKPSSVPSISVPGSRTGPSNASGDAASGHPKKADGLWLQRLVEINMQLFDHANRAQAGACDSGPVSDPTADNEASSSTIHRPPGFNSFDETIVLSFYLVRALHSLYDPESLRMDQDTSLPVGPPPSLDSGTMLIIFSCYVRMLDLFMDRLGGLRSALNTNPGPSPPSTPHSGPGGAGLLLPTLVACGCPLEGYQVLRLRMTLELVEEVLEVTSALVTPIVHGIGDQSQSGDSSLMPVVSPQALSTREQAACRIIKEIRVDLRRHRRIMVI